MKHGHRFLIGALVAMVLAVTLILLAPWGQEPVAANGTIRYVDADAGGANNGSSWADAFTELQPALDAAVSGDQIWVAAGTYTPTQESSPGDPRSVTFQMKNGVAIYGGFDPSVGHIDWEDRDWEAHPTILSGDLNGDDGEDFANNDENSYHVFYHPEEYTDLDSTAILDGFSIAGANGGGGMHNYSSSPTLTNCTFYANWNSGSGGGMSNGDSSPTLTNCTFSGNSAYTGGGGMYNWASFPTLTNCTFSGNSAGDGGGMFNLSSSPELTNCTFSGNSAGDLGLGGGMCSADQSSPTLTNCTFSGNSAYEGGGMYNGDFSTTLTNCILRGDTPNEIGGRAATVEYSNIQGGAPGVGNIDLPPFFVDPANGDFHLRACSPCIDAGNNEAPGLPDFDFEGDDRIVDGDDDGTAIVDMGVDEVVDGLPCMHVYLPLVLRGY